MPDFGFSSISANTVTSNRAKAIDTGTSGTSTGLSGYVPVPDLSAGVAITAGTNAYGTWGTITTGLAYDVYIVGIQVGFTTNPAADWTYYQLALGIGSGPTQVSALKLAGVNFVTAVGVTAFPALWLPFPIRVAANVQVSCRSASDAGTPAANVSLTVIRADDLLLA